MPFPRTPRRTRIADPRDPERYDEVPGFDLQDEEPDRDGRCPGCGILVENAGAVPTCYPCTPKETA